MKTRFQQLREQGILSELDFHFAKLITSLSDNQSDELWLSAILASHLTAEGHVCVDLAAQAEQLFPQQSEVNTATIRCPPLEQWLEALQNCQVVGNPGDYAPLILDQQRLYLYRYWDYEQQLATQIRTRCHKQRTDINPSILEAGLSRLFPAQNENNHTPNAQQIAAQTAVQRHFCIISGGPGTGKTSTIIKILALLLEQNRHLKIALAAPTGKAAVRLQEAITQALQALNCAPEIKAAIPQDTYTIHRLLGTQTNSPYFRSHANNLLPYDVIVIDEASMVDLALMAKLAQAIPKSARWILLGDKDQLASVEAGTVLGDICDAAGVQELQESQALESIPKTPHYQNNIVLLNKSYRFSEDSGIWTLSNAVNQGESEQALRILKSDEYKDVIWYPLGLSESLPNSLIEHIVASIAHCLQASEPEKILQAFEKFRVLCATRQGRYGVERVNQRIEQLLSAKGIIRAAISHRYHGRPIMITRNNYSLKLFNGDIGILLRNPAKPSELQAYFPATEGGIRTFWPERLPEHETVYAMTIHKSQGSEFENVFMLLPEQLTPLLTRELIYTGLTRARQNVHIWGNEQIFKQAISQQINRTSGLTSIIAFPD
ncbi:MAG: exodeoxyribonuclease V subunit alpha [Candidatus Parabeggiatoa sp. nov. 3]|nr:MAG: exodeoxyribonuclease V subunit alpha [Gammaproteobacteria bacterium]